MILIGLTGGISTGKSTVIRQLLKDCSNDELGVIDCDALVHQLQAPGSAVVHALKREWPHIVDEETMTFDRRQLSDEIFENANARKRLARIMFFPLVKAILNALWTHFQSFLSKPDRLVLLDAPTLYETQWLLPLLDSVVVVAADTPIQLERLQRRNNLSYDDALARVNVQLPMEHKVREADYVVWNNKGLKELQVNVEEFKMWMETRKGWRHRFAYVLLHNILVWFIHHVQRLFA